MANGNGQASTKLLTWILGVAMMILFGAVGLLVGDIRSNIELNRQATATLERRIQRTEAELHEEQQLTKQYRDWFGPRIEQIERSLRELGK